MLPGFRFLFGAIMLSISILVFGLGAAALLRAAHEKFASNPSWRATPEATFAQQAEAPRPVLAMLRFDPPPVEQKAPDDDPAASPAAVAPAEQAAAEQAKDIAPAQSVPSVPAPAEQAASAAVPAATAPPPSTPERVATLRPEQPAPSVAASPERPAAENAAQSEAAAAPIDPPAADVVKDAPAADLPKAATPAADAGDTKVASTEQVAPSAPVLPPASETAPMAPEPVRATASADSNAASTKIAMLGGPPVEIETRPPAKAVVHAKPDQAIKKPQAARQAVHRRRLAARARKPGVLAQQPASPFGQSFAQPPAAARSF